MHEEEYELRTGVEIKVFITRCLFRRGRFRVEYAERPHEFLEIDHPSPLEIEQVEDLPRARR